MTTFCKLDTRGYYVEHVISETGQGLDASWIVAEPPENLEVFNRRYATLWIEEEARQTLTAPAPVQPVAEPVRRSKIEVRRLLKPKEALWFDNALAEPPMTLQAIDEAFNPNTTTPSLQLEAMKRDAIFQWRLLPDLIEMDHNDTRDFMYVMGACGMFGADAMTRIPQVLACQTPS